MLFMIIERFKDQDMLPVYKRFREGGRLLPEGLKYIDSWVEPNFVDVSNLWNATTFVYSRNGYFDGAVRARRLKSCQ